MRKTALAFLLMSLCGSWSAIAAPSYPKVGVNACCKLCPAAADVQLYQGDFLESFKTLIQGKDGWLFRTEADLLMELGLSSEGLRRIGRLARALRDRNVALVLVVQPPRGLMHADKLADVPVPYDAELVQMRYTNMLDALREQGLVVPPLERLVEEGGRDTFFFRADHHWTPEGARRTARVVAETIRELPEFSGLKRQRFVTRRSGLLAKRGTMSKAAQQLCGFGAAEQFVPRYITELADGDSGGDLFGDDTAPQITLVGTSNSDTPYNFSGFLSEYLQADVLNVAQAGGGFEGAMLGYLPSAEFQQTPPRILIWEVETYHDLSDPRFYQQALPLMGRDCGGRAPVLERRLKLRRGLNEVLFNGGGTVRQIRGRDHFLDLQFGDPGARELRATVWYTNGTKDSIRLERSERAANPGRFVLDLRDEGNWGEQVFLSLDIDNPPPAPPAEGAPPVTPQASQLHVRLCVREQMQDDAAGAKDAQPARVRGRKR